MDLLRAWEGDGLASRNSTDKKKLRFTFLSKVLFPVGKDFWWEQLPRRHKVIPYLVHVNWAMVSKSRAIASEKQGYGSSKILLSILLENF